MGDQGAPEPHRSLACPKWPPRSDAPPGAAADVADEEGFERAMTASPLSLDHLDMDAYADGVIAHRQGVPFHGNPHLPNWRSLRRLSWGLGWNQRALQESRGG